MESENSSPPLEKTRRIIKRYSNRKLYDTKDSRYVTLQQIGEMVKGGEEVQIIDNATKEDKTEVTLALILSEDIKSSPRSVPLHTLRNLIQEQSEKILSQLREGPIGRLIPGSQQELPEGSTLVEEAEQPVPQQETEKNIPKTRFAEIVEISKQTLDQWHHTIDDRVRLVLPGNLKIKELESEMLKLKIRIETLETKCNCDKN